MTEGPYKGLVITGTDRKAAENRTITGATAAKRLNLLLANHFAPDGLAWTKCCRGDKDICLGQTANCAFVDKRLDKSNARPTPFPCVHRTTESGFLRVCAGWHAIFGRGYAAREQGEQGEQGEREKK